MVNTKINGQYELMLPEHRAMRPEWETGWEVKRIDTMINTLDEKDILFYIGCEEGDIPALIVKYTNCDIVLFEPNERVYPCIKAIWEGNNTKPPLDFYRGFASDHTLTAIPRLKDRQFGGINIEDMISDHGFKHLHENQSAFSVTIDTYCNITKLIPTAITLDVEGSEFKVLKGAEKTLKEFKPKIWLSAHPEFMVLHYNQWLAELREYLILLGYREKLLEYPKHELHLYYEAI